MPLTPAQRRKQNQINAQHSTGPKSQEGKNRSRGNRLTHGLTAQVLSLPDENPEEIAAQTEAWHDACQPQGLDEETLVGQLALTSLRLGRLSKAEAAVLAEQVRTAESDWDRDKDRRLLECTRLFKTDPALAFIELNAFASGVEWMIERWTGLLHALEKFHCWNSLELIKEAIRLEGGDPERLRDQPMDVQEFAVVACSCIAGYQSKPAIAAFLSQQSAEWIGRYSDLTWPAETARPLIADLVRRRIAELNDQVETMRLSENDSRSESTIRATAPHDTPGNRLLYRYMKTAELSFDRTLKTLQKIQADRQKAAEKAAKIEAKAVFPNEADLVAGSHSSQMETGSCITIAGKEYEVSDASEGNILMTLRSSTVDMADPGGVAAA